MDPALAQLGWTDEQWNRICTTVTEEAQKARVAAQVLPVVGPEDPSTVAIPRFTLGTQQPAPPPWPATGRPVVNSTPDLSLTTIFVDVPLRGHEIADPNLGAALTMFRRAANYVARIEDAIVFNGRTGGPIPRIPVAAVASIPPVYTIATDSPGRELGIFNGGNTLIPLPPNPGGQALINGVVNGITQLESLGQLPPFACILGSKLFEVACGPNSNFVMPRDRILPLIEGPLVRTGTTFRTWGAMIALNGSPVELVVASDVNVQYLQTTVEPRYVFRVVERVALRIKEPDAIAVFIS
jgi:uncharacterized linocin/CFP29 family protein